MFYVVQAQITNNLILIYPTRVRPNLLRKILCTSLEHKRLSRELYKRPGVHSLESKLVTDGSLTQLFYSKKIPRISSPHYKKDGYCDHHDKY